MRLVEDYSPEELKRRHIKIYRGGNPAISQPSPTEILSNRIDDLESQSLPSLFSYNHPEIREEKKVEPRQQTNNYEYLDQLKAHLLYLEKKLNEHLDAIKPKQNINKPMGTVPL